MAQDVSGASDLAARGSARGKGLRLVQLTAPFTLGLWRIRRMWRLLLTIELGMVAAVLVVCAVPLFSQVALYAGLQDALARYHDANTLYAHVGTNAPTAQLLRQIEGQAHDYVRTTLGGTGIQLQGVPQIEMGAHNLEIATVPTVAATQAATVQPTASPSTNSSTTNATSSASTHARGDPLSTARAAEISGSRSGGSADGGSADGGSADGGSADGVSILGYPLDQLQHQVRVLSGRLPQPTSDGLEVAITDMTARQLHLRLGATLALATSATATVSPLRLRITGIIVGDDPAGYNNFEPNLGYGPNGQRTNYSAVTTTEAITASTYPWTATVSIDAPPDAGYQPPRWFLTWQSSMDLSQLTPAMISQLVQNGPLFPVSQAVKTQDEHIDISTNLFTALTSYSHRMLGAQIAVGVLLLSVVGLVLLYLGQMNGILLERQESLIALLRSRGASRRQLVATFVAQSVELALIALVLGPLLAVPVTRLVASTLLPPRSAFAMGVLNGNPLPVALGLWPFAVGATLVAILAMLRSVTRAAALNVLALRRETARSQRKPLWQRLYLDVLAAILALMGYGLLALARGLAAAYPSAQNTRVQIGLAPLALVAPMFLMVAIALLFLRIFPLLLRLGERLAARGRGSATVLAFTQLARSARQAQRLALLLALATGFTLMAASSYATINHYADDAATFQAGADFSGGLAETPQSADGVATRTAAYLGVPGVRAAALGFVTGGSFTAPGEQPSDWSLPQGMAVTVVDAPHYATAVDWPAGDGPRSADELMRLLQTGPDGPRLAPDGGASAPVPAIVGAQAQTRLHVHAGSILAMWMPGVTAQPVHFVVVAVVPHIPQIHDDQQTMAGGMLVAAAAYTQAFAAMTGTAASAALTPNFVWLRTGNDAASLKSVRATIAAGPLRLQNTYATGPEFPLEMPVTDRRALAEGLHTDALYIDLTGVLLLSSATTLLLALLGTLTATWLATSSRQTSFALLRALGAGPRRIVQQVRWEHGVISGIALLLGALLGALLAITMSPALPELIFGGSFGGPVEDGGMPVRMVWPFGVLSLTLAVLALICGIAIFVAARTAARPSLAATLRLNED